METLARAKIRRSNRKIHVGGQGRPQECVRMEWIGLVAFQFRSPRQGGRSIREGVSSGTKTSGGLERNGAAVPDSEKVRRGRQVFVAGRPASSSGLVWAG